MPSGIWSPGDPTAVVAAACAADFAVRSDRRGRCWRVRACGSVAHGATVAPARGETSLAAAIADAKVAYLRDCATCHGADARGTAFGPTLQGVGAAAVDYWVSTGRMPLVCERAPSEVAAGCSAARPVSRRPERADPAANPAVLAGRDSRAGCVRGVDRSGWSGYPHRRPRPSRIWPRVARFSACSAPRAMLVGRRRRAVSTIRAEPAAGDADADRGGDAHRARDRCPRSASPRCRTDQLDDVVGVCPVSRSSKRSWRSTAVVSRTGCRRCGCDPSRVWRRSCW